MTRLSVWLTTANDKIMRIMYSLGGLTHYYVLVETVLPENVRLSADFYDGCSGLLSFRKDRAALERTVTVMARAAPVSINGKMPGSMRWATRR